MKPATQFSDGRKLAAPSLHPAGHLEAGGRSRSFLPALPITASAFTSRSVRHAGDTTAALVACAGALWSWSAIDGQPLTLHYLWDRAAWFAMAGIWLLLLQLASASRLPFTDWDTTSPVTRAVAAGIALYLAVYFLAPRALLPRLVVLNFLASAAVATLVSRVVFRHLIAEDTRQSVAVVGTGPAAHQIAAILRQSTPSTKVVGLFRTQDGDNLDPRPGETATLRRLVARRQVSALVLAPEGPMGEEVLRTVVGAREHDIDVVPMQPVYEQVLRRTPVRYSDPAWVLDSITAARQSSSSASGIVKRAVDVVGACGGCALLLLLLPALGPLVWLDVRAPVFYRQVRLGLAGRRFRILKFRTMGPAAESGGPRWAAARDSRASRFGRFLRRCHLDEIPQFWNVLRGDMSLVGPRPERPEFVDELAHSIPSYRERLRVRPGLSGWAQVNHDYGGSVDGTLNKLEYDLYYIKHRNLWFDVVIIWRTIWMVVARGGR